MAINAYSKTTWTDRVVQFVRRYRDQSNNQYTFTPDEGSVTNAGTPFSATNMNKIENGIEAVTSEVISHLADYLKHGIRATTDAGGTSTAYIITLNPALSAYATGLEVTLFFDKANTGSATLNINGKGAVALKKQDGSTYASSELATSTPYIFVYNGADFINASAAGGASIGSFEFGLPII